MPDTLLPCPFCGAEAEYDNSDHGPYEWINCADCGAKGPSVNYNNEGLGSARLAWNKRHELRSMINNEE